MVVEFFNRNPTVSLTFGARTRKMALLFDKGYHPKKFESGVSNGTKVLEQEQFYI